MAAIESRIDELYKLTLDEFTAARNALARTVGGEDVSRVKRLAKPTVVPWAVNQVYWRDRPAFDRMRKAGERLRAAQIAALKGRAVDVRDAAEAHRQALADASRRALDLAAAAGSHPDPDELTRTLEAISLAPELPEPPGRLTRALQPAGFEALAGIAPAGRPATTGARGHTGRRSGPRRRARKAAPEAEEQRADAERRRAELEMQRAQAAFDRAGAAETRARLVWERTKRELDEAERALTRARDALAEKTP